MMGHIMHFLATNPEKRAELAADPARLSANAAEEFLRRFALTNPARTVTKDLEFHAVKMKAGDKIMLVTPFGALDPREYDDPLTVDFNRKSNMKTTFGAGTHVCPGSMLARIEMRILIEEWMSRIPDFRLDPDQLPRIRTRRERKRGRPKSALGHLIANISVGHQPLRHLQTRSKSVRPADIISVSDDRCDPVTVCWP